jgi:hypothetical protein
MTVLTGTRNTRTGLWRFPMQTPQTPTEIPINPQCANALQLHTGIRRMIQFLHAAAFGPVKSTWITAIKRGYFATWPGLTQPRSINITHKPLPHPKATWINPDKTHNQRRSRHTTTKHRPTHVRNLTTPSPTSSLPPSKKPDGSTPTKQANSPSGQATDTVTCS